MGIGDWGLGPIPNPQSPIPNPQSPLKNIKIQIKINILFITILITQFKNNTFSPHQYIKISFLFKLISMYYSQNYK